MQDGLAEKAHRAAIMARRELKGAAVLGEYAKRLAVLEVAIATTNKAHQWRQKAYGEIESVLKSVHLAQVLEATLGYFLLL
jgi:hypothetical protein